MTDECLGAQSTTVDGRPVRYRIVRATKAGSRSSLGLPLLLIHGLGCSSEAWGPTLQWLARRQLDQPVIAPDVPGYGHSPGPRAALGISELAEWAARLLDVLDISRTHLAGSSMGCQVALALARRQPARVGGIVLAGPTTGGSLVPLGRYLHGLLRDSVRESLRYNAVLSKMVLQMGLRRYFATVGKMIQDDPLAQIDAVTSPCLIVRGTRDAIVPAWVARRLATRLPFGSLAELEGEAHAVQFNAPEPFTQLALAFLAGSIRDELSLDLDPMDDRRRSPGAVPACLPNDK